MICYIDVSNKLRKWSILLEGTDQVKVKILVYVVVHFLSFRNKGNLWYLNWEPGSCLVKWMWMCFWFLFSFLFFVEGGGEWFMKKRILCGFHKSFMKVSLSCQNLKILFLIFKLCSAGNIINVWSINEYPKKCNQE